MRILVFIISILIGSQSFAGTKRWIPNIAPGYSDNFNRADGTLGANWTTNATDIPANGTTLKISSNTTIPAANDNHALAFYTNAIFAADQYGKCDLVNVVASPGNGWNGGIVLRGNVTVDKFFLGFVFNSQQCSFDVRTTGAFPSYPGNALGTYTSQTWSSGDTMEMRCYDSDPARLYMLRNGVLIASTVAPGYGITSGKVGIGVYNPTGQSLGDDNWVGGNAPLLAPESVPDNFTRANADTLGWDWVNGCMYNAVNSSQNGNGLKIASNKATPISTGASQVHWAFRAKDFTTNHSCSIVIGTSGGSSDWQGPIVGSDFNSYYIVIVVGTLPSSTVQLYEFDGASGAPATSAGYHLISNVTATVASGDTLELDDTASGTPNRTLTVKQNGTTKLTTTDSTYKLKGTHVGIGITANAGGQTVTSWSAASL